MNGRKINLVSLDDQSNPALGRSDYLELAQKKALAMFGCVYTAVCQAAAPLAGEYKVPIVSEGGTDSDLFPAKPYLYSNDLPQGLQPVVMVDEVAALAKAAHITKVRLAWIGANTSPTREDGVATLKKLVKDHPWLVSGRCPVPSPGRHQRLVPGPGAGRGQADFHHRGAQRLEHHPDGAGAPGRWRVRPGHQRHGRLG